MRAILQRVASASVSVGEEVVGRIGKGLLIFVGIGAGDMETQVEYLANKTRYLRIFSDADGKMNLDVEQAGGRILAISNFTLYADTRQGRRPAFTGAAPPSVAEPLFERYCACLRKLGLHVETGRFGEMMSVVSDNDGPINVILDSADR